MIYLDDGTIYINIQEPIDEALLYEWLQYPQTKEVIIYNGEYEQTLRLSRKIQSCNIKVREV